MTKSNPWPEGATFPCQPLSTAACLLQTGPFGSQLGSDDYVEAGVPVINPSHIDETGLRPDPSVAVSIETRARLSRHMLQPGDIVFARRGELGRAALVGQEAKGWLCGTGSLVARLRLDVIEPRFLLLVTKSERARAWLSLQSVGSTMDNLNASIIGGMPIPLPALTTQRRIADFLDAKTAAIDLLIAKKEQLLALLAEKRQALITQAVTKGLDSNAPMKDSGVSLLGAVPQHWYVCRIGHVALVGNGSTPRRDEERYWGDENSGFPWLNSAKINDEEIASAEQWVTEEALRDCHLPRVPADSVVVAITGEGRTRGRAALLQLEATISQHLAFIRPQSRITAPFLWRQLQAYYGWLRDESAGGGSTRAALTCEFLRSVHIAVPPFDEQERIVVHIRRELRRLDALARRSEAMVEKLREYRQALITAAVTGKLDVTSAATVARTSRHPPEAEVA